MDRAAAHNLGVYHPPTGQQVGIYEANRALYAAAVDHVYDTLPDATPERTLAVRSLHRFLMDLNAAVAVTGAGAAPGTPS